MYSVLDIQFWLFAVFFVAVAFLSFFIPGFYFLRRFSKQPALSTFVLSTVLGIVLWAIQGYLFGFLQLRFFTFVYVAFCFLWFVREKKIIIEFLKKVGKEIKSFDKGVSVLLGLGFILQLLPMLPSGMRFGDGVRFYFVNEADGVMHLSYIQSIIRSFPPMEPGAVGLSLVNYHYWSDLVIAEMSRVFALPVAHLFFQYIPILLFFLTSLSVVFLICAWGGSLKVVRWGLFLLFFSGDAAYIIYFILHQQLAFHTPAIDNGVTQFFNMPHAFAKVIFLSGVLTLHLWITKKKKAWGIITVLFFASLFGFKVYYGLFAAMGFSFIVAGKAIISFYQEIWKKKTVTTFSKVVTKVTFPLVLLLLFAGVALLIYLPTNSGAGGLFFSPLEWPKLLLGEQALNFREWWLRRQVYEVAGNTRNVLILDLLALCIALVSIHGTRLLGFFPNKKLLRSLKWEGTVFLLPGVVIFTLLGFFTLQESGLFNIFNFFVMSLVILSLFTAFVLGDLSESKKIWAKGFLVLFVLLTIPRILFETASMISSYSSGKYRLISNDELEALTFIREKTSKASVIQSHPKNSLDSITPYVSYYTDRSTYFTGGGLLATHNQPIEERRKKIEDIFLEPNVTEFAATLRDTNIQYVYLLKNGAEKLSFKEEPPHITTVFENASVVIYRVF